MENYYMNRVKKYGLVFHEDKVASENKNLECISLKDNQIKQYGVPLRVTQEGQVYFSKELANALVIGNSGSGKTTNVSLIYAYETIKAGHSCVIADTKGTIYRCTSELAEKEGYKKIVVNLADKLHSNHFNPLEYPYLLSQSKLESDQEKGSELLGDFVDMLKETQTTDVFWENASAQTMEGEIRILFDLAKDKSQVTMDQLFSNIHEAGNKQRGASILLNKLLDYKYIDDTVIYSMLSSYLNAPSDTKKSIDSVLLEKYNRYLKNESLIRLMSDNEIDFEHLLDQKTIIYIILPDFNTKYHFLASIIIKQVLVCLEREADLKYSGKLPNKFSFILEEAGQYCIKDLSSIISTSRSRNIEFLMIVQSFAQLYELYGMNQAKTIIENMVLIYLYGKDEETLSYISRLGGEKIEYVHNHKEVTPKFSVNELLNIPKNTGIICMNRRRAFFTEYTSYYELDLGLNELAKALPKLKETHKTQAIDMNEIVNQLIHEERAMLFASQQMNNEKKPCKDPQRHVIENLLKNIDKKIKELEE